MPRDNIFVHTRLYYSVPILLEVYYSIRLGGESIELDVCIESTSSLPYLQYAKTKYK